MIGVFGLGSPSVGSPNGIGTQGAGGAVGVSGFPLGGPGSIGVVGESLRDDNFAGVFMGSVRVTGPLFKLGGGFEIDHPLDPENKYLRHSFVESPDMLNVYSGTVTTDAKGEAIVRLPDYFEALNQDFRYQLTVIGQFVQAIVGQEIRDNEFTIKTDQPRVKVSWQVTGVRQDAWAVANRISVDEEKAGEERGRYLQPQLHGQPEEAGMHAKVQLLTRHEPEELARMTERAGLEAERRQAEELVQRMR